MAPSVPSFPIPAAYPEEAFVVEADGALAAPSAELLQAAEEAAASMHAEPEMRLPGSVEDRPTAAAEQLIVADDDDDTSPARLVVMLPPADQSDAVDEADAADATGGNGQTGAPHEAEGADGSLQLDLPLEVGAADIRSEPSDMPSFVRKAERAARWRRPWVRAALASACLVAGLALAGQWMLAQRDLLAARSPALKPLLSTACTALGCQVRAPRALEALRVESSGVARVERSDLYRLTVALRNLRTHEVALPAIELALTDTQGRLIARRVLRAGELGARSGAVAGGAELTLQGTLQVGSGTVAGYTIELFYP